MEGAIELTKQEGRELERRVRSRRLRAEDVRRARLILMLAIWFSKIERHVIARGVFTSVSHLSRKLMGFIRH